MSIGRKQSSHRERLVQRLQRTVGRIAGRISPTSDADPNRRRPPPRPSCEPRSSHLSSRAQSSKLRPDRPSLEASADPQERSRFFTVLPAEVRRLVYAFMWRMGGHIYGIHVLHEPDRGAIRSAPCSLGPGHFGAAADANAELDALFAGKGVGEEARLRGVRLRGERLQALVERLGRTHLECHDDGVYGPRNAARFRTGEGVDPLALWSPFLPVLLTCKRMYLESVDTIFQDLPPIFDPCLPDAAHSLLCLEPHPSVHNLRTVILSSDYYAATAITPAGPLDDASRPAWTRVFAALERVPSLREVRLSLRRDPLDEADADLRPLARSAGAALAAKFVVDLMPADNRKAACRACGRPAARFIVPAGNADGGDNAPVGGAVEPRGRLRASGAAGAPDDCPPFGRVVWREAPRYVVEMDRFPAGLPVARALSRDLCVLCNLGGYTVRDEYGEPHPGVLPPLE